ncbi:MAG TPA: sodium:solute symporter [Ignavibacteriales bacterium]|nr:sodium:solute symporter [Ignavibacteriales bacterium]
MISALSGWDNLIIFLYFAATLGIGFFYSRKKDKDTSEYFLGGRSAGWLAVGASLFATNISSEHFLGLAGSGSVRGFASGQIEWMAIFFIIFLGWILSPIYLKSGVFTVPEFFEKRFDSRVRNYLTGVSLLAYVLTKISVTLFAGGLLLRELLGWDLVTSSVIMVMFAGIYAVSGGLKAVINVHIVQTFLLIAAASIVTIFGLYEVGGIAGLKAKLPAEYFDLMKPASDKEYPWTGMLFGAPILAIWYWCTDQYIVQRILSAKSVKDARNGSFFAAGLKILPLFILVMPGMIAAALNPNISGDEAFPYLLNGGLLPEGIKGFVLAGIMAALMSSLASVFNSSAALFTIDYYKPRHPEASERKLVLVGRLVTTVVVVTAILWLPLMKFVSKQIYIYMQSVQAFISPPIVAVFIFGVFGKKANSKGAFWTLVIGGAIGFLRLALELLINAGAVSNPAIIAFSQVNYLHFAALLFVFCSFLIFALSKIWEKDNQTEEERKAAFVLSIREEAQAIPAASFFAGRKNLFISAIILAAALLGIWGFII